jgi:hypothetical protein
MEDVRRKVLTLVEYISMSGDQSQANLLQPFFFRTRIDRQIGKVLRRRNT